MTSLYSDKIFGNKKAGTAKTTFFVILNLFPLIPNNKKYRIGIWTGASGVSAIPSEAAVNLVKRPLATYNPILHI